MNVHLNREKIVHILHIIYRTENLFLLVALPAIAAFLYITPQSWGLDEQVHVARAYQIADGGFYPDRTEHGYGGLLPVSLINVLNDGHYQSNTTDRKVAVYEESRRDIRNEEETRRLGEQKINTTTTAFYEFGTTGPYSPVVYLPAAAGIKLGMIFNVSVDTALTFARALQAMFYVACAYVSLLLLSSRKIKWLFFLVTLLPMNIFLAITINADAYTNGIVLFYTALIVHLFMIKRKFNNLEEALLYISSFGLMLTKPSYAIGLLAVLFLPKSLFRNIKSMYIKKAIIFLTAACIFLLFAVKGLQYGDSMDVYFTSEQAKNIDMIQQIEYVVTHPGGFISTLSDSVMQFGYIWQSGIVGTLGYNTVATPHVLIMLMTVMLVLAALYTDRLKSYQSYLFIGLALISTFSVIFLLYITFNQIGSSLVQGVQGRYFIPCTLFLLVGLAGVLKARVLMSSMRASILFTVTATIVLYGTLVSYCAALF